MCGIAGWFRAGPVHAGDGARLARMLGAIAHRGPDGSGTQLAAGHAFGHVRLAIIDLDGGAQPMRSTDGALTIVYNGEIYNYAELGAELRARGLAFATRSDTEVILNLYRADGIGALARLRGMFAFALWDGSAGRGWLVRDRHGIKPLFWARGPDGELLFASEAKAIRAALGAGALDEAALHLALNFRYVPGERSLFRGIRQLAPGAVLGWRDGDCAGSALAAYPLAQAPEPLAALQDSVRAHLAADVEVATYLSGGIDSAAVTAFARPHVSGRLRAFTVDIGDDPAEAANAARTAQLLDVDNVRVPSAAGAANLPAILWHLEVPKVNAWQVALVASATSRHVKVALSGLGGDEVFLGYNLHRMIDRGAAAARWLPRWGRCAASLLAGRARALGLPDWSEPERALRACGALGDWPAVYGLLRNVWDAPGRRMAIYGPRLLDAQLPDAWAEVRAGWPAGAAPLAATAAFERRHKLVNDLLWQEDRLGMATGLEVRVPFVDAVLDAAVARLSPAQLMPGGRLKGYLRDALAPVLPAEVLARPKSGFQVDAVAFFRTHLAALASVFLDEATVRRHGLFNPAFVRDVLARPAHRRLRWHYFMLYLMLGAHLWLEMFEHGRAPDDLAQEGARP